MAVTFEVRLEETMGDADETHQYMVIAKEATGSLVVGGQASYETFTSADGSVKFMYLVGSAVLPYVAQVHEVEGDVDEDHIRVLVEEGDIGGQPAGTVLTAVRAGNGLLITINGA